MHLYLDTADIDQIRKGVKLGVVSGVTTNPSLVYKAGWTDYKSAVQEICSIVKGPVSVEVVSQEAKGMMEEARAIAKWSEHVVIKIPMCDAGLEAMSVLSKENIRVNVTLCFSLNQALLGALAGASYVSPFVGRLDDVGHDGMGLVAEIVSCFDRYGFGTQVIAASIRHPLHCIAAAKAGAHIATIPYGVLTQMVNHPLTTVGIARFLEDSQKAAGKG
ncbi:MAG: fructose-6-phosphate aldolase [Dehalococcoidia bacterium]|nr:fructose-6-phosphate aldolase [Dehalococcoidia bacterium]